ncbi:hypothetical protein [Mucilaginibacter defluvii]|uniref:Uncharacterized protein n=1 Tax=Mucilaginibacter defluvii TaxID=1196019 RepID=A0ABP9FMG6_9SPHI
MKRYLTIITLIAFLISCKSKEEKLKEQFLPIISNVVKQDSLIYKMDSLTIFKIDTLSDLKIAQQQISNKSRDFEFFMSMVKSYNSQTELAYKSASLNAQQASLYYNILESDVLGDIAKDKVKTEVSRAKELSAKSQKYLDSAKLVNSQIDNLDKKIKNKKINTKNFKGYVVWFNLLGSDKKNMEVRRDSLYIFISPSLRVIPTSKV